MSYSSDRRYWLDTARLRGQRGQSHSQKVAALGLAPLVWGTRSPNRAQSLVEAGEPEEWTSFMCLFVCDTSA